MALEAGARLGSYVVVQLLGAGGMGEVYRARDDRLGRDVALKVLPPQLAQDRDALARFEREAKTASALNHPHIVNIYEIGEADTPAGAARYIAMEFVEGQTLRARLKAGARWRELGEPLAQVADALARAHKAGIVHRDLKPENVMITADGYPKVVDFGLAKLTQQEGSADAMAEKPTAASEGRTKSGMILGTPGYMSPEQVQGKPADSRSDIFSFGCILYEAAAGRAPFKGDSAVATLHAIVYDNPPPLESLGVDAPAELRRIVSKCLAKDPARRYQAMREAADDLRALLRSEASQEAIPTGVLGPGESARAVRARWLMGGAVVSAVLAGTVLGLRVWTGRGPVPTGTPATAIRIEKLTSRGDVRGGLVSPDGRYLAYNVKEGGRWTIWLRDVTEKTETRLVPQLPRFPWLIRFANDGQSVYYSRRSEDESESALYRVPLIGGEPRLIRTAASLVHLSPDTTRLAFRRSREGNEFLVVAGVDGGAEKELAEWPADPGPLAWSPDGARLIFSGGKQGRYSLVVVDADGSARRKVGEIAGELDKLWWTPDGTSVLCAVESTRGDQKQVRIIELDLASGATRSIGEAVWHQIEALRWLPDTSRFVLNDWNKGWAIWRVSYPEGKAERIPADTHEYSDLDMTADGTKIVAVQSSKRSEVLVSSDAARGPFKRVVAGTDVSHSVCWTSDGKVVYASNEGGSYDLYVSDADGSNAKQLTFDRSGNEIEPAASPDGRYIVFASDRPGEKGIYRLNRDGTGLRRLTTSTSDRGDQEPQVLPDSRWVLYSGWDNGPTLWKVPIEGGTPVLIKGARPATVFDEAYGASASPDGKWLAFFYFTLGPADEGSATDIAIASPDGHIVKRLPFLPGPGVRDNLRIQWSRDGTAVYYQAPGGGVWNLWRRAISGGPPVQASHFDEDIGDFDWSPDGRALVCSRESHLSDVVLITGFR